MGEQSATLPNCPPGTTDCPTSNPDDPFHGNGTIVFEVLRRIYIVAILVIFVTSLGNRPQGSKHIYTSVFVLFTLVMGVMIFMASYTVYAQIPLTPAQHALAGSLLSRPGFRDILISVGSTYGIYVVASILHFDPWHMLTSFLQYLLLLPSFVNVLMVYACEFFYFLFLPPLHL